VLTGRAARAAVTAHRRDRLQGKGAAWALLAILLALPAGAPAADAPATAPPVAAADAGPDSYWPALLGAQYTYVLQHQTALDSPYAGRLSLLPSGDTQATNTIGFYGGWGLASWAQLYLDTEKFMGAGVSGATGLGGLTNGDVVREGAVGLKKTFYIARAFARFMVPLGGSATHVERGQDQIAGNEVATRLELKAGRMAVNDDFDHNRYAGATRTEFMNWSLWDNTAWDYAANTRGYSDGVVLGYVSPQWTLKYGIYRMPLYANAQTLETLNRAQGQNLELTVAPWSNGAVLRFLTFRNTARMGDYDEALAIAAAAGTLPDVAADARDGRHKYGFGVNGELPLADEGETGLFARLGWNNGATESFVFTEVDRLVSFGGQLSGSHWARPQDRLGLGFVVEGLAAAHREYLAAGGAGFLLDDGRLNYAHEQILESYYRLQVFDAIGRLPVRMQLGPDVQLIRNPGFNQDRGPARFYALRVHLEY
jgi:high affinity Mn2+ porin